MRNLFFPNWCVKQLALFVGFECLLVILAPMALCAMERPEDFVQKICSIPDYETTVLGASGSNGAQKVLIWGYTSRGLLEQKIFCGHKLEKKLSTNIKKDKKIFVDGIDSAVETDKGWMLTLGRSGKVYEYTLDYVENIKTLSFDSLSYSTVIVADHISFLFEGIDQKCALFMQVSDINFTALSTGARKIYFGNNEKYCVYDRKTDRHWFGCFEKFEFASPPIFVKEDILLFNSTKGTFLFEYQEAKEQPYFYKIYDKPAKSVVKMDGCFAALFRSSESNNRDIFIIFESSLPFEALRIFDPKGSVVAAAPCPHDSESILFAKVKKPTKKGGSPKSKIRQVRFLGLMKTLADNQNKKTNDFLLS